MRKGSGQGNKRLGISFHPSFWFLAFSFVLAGYYANLVVFTSLIVVHELGHCLMARMNGISVLEIVIYPYGGVLKLDGFLNLDILRELLVAMAGVIFQFLFFMVIYFLYQKGIVREYIYVLYKQYNSSMIFFNLLPIYPLDGGRIVYLFICLIVPFYFANLVMVIFSSMILVFVIFMNVFVCNYSSAMVFLILVVYIISFFRKRKYLYQRFLLERYLYHIQYDKVSYCRGLKGFYKNRNHFFFRDGKMINEDEYLINFFGNE